MRGVRSAAIVSLAGLLLAVAFVVGPSPGVRGASVGYLPHAPIVIEGDGGFEDPANGVVGGNGTALDPYVIEGWDIDASATDGISIRNTTATFVIRGSLIHGAGYNFYYDGVRFTNVLHGSVENTTLTRTYAGLGVDRSADIRLASSATGPGTGIGVYATDSSDLLITSSNLSDDDLGISAFTSRGITVLNSTLARDRYGLDFYECSDIVVNGNSVTAMSWLGVVFDAGGENVSVSNNTIQDTGQWGLFVDYVTNATVSGNTIAGSSDAGMYGYSNTNMTIRDNNFSSNGFEGLRIQQTTPLTVEWNVMDGNSLGAEIGYLSNATVNGNRVSNNTNEGLLLHTSADVVVRGNSFDANGGPGLSMYFDERITIAANTFRSDGVLLYGDSYESVVHFNSHTISSDNRVNGLSLGYYKDCDGLSVEGVSLGQLIVVNCTDVRIANLTISDADFAIQTAYVDRLEIAKNGIASNGKTGVSLYHTDHANIHDNNFSLNNDGLHIVTGDWTVVHNNSFTGNGRAVVLEASRNLTVSSNKILDSLESGIVAEGDDTGLVSSNRVLRSRYEGIVVGDTRNLIVTRNLVSQNGDAGIDVGYGGRNTIRENWIESNGAYGVYAFYTTRNRVYHNDFINNTIQAAEAYAYLNEWDDGYPGGGNFWSDYAGADDCSGPNQTVCTDPDYLGDTPYPVTPPSQDRYPLMQGFEVNTAPRASFESVPSSAPTNTTFVVDASGSMDRQDPLALLEVRWDWEADGVWDTDWSLNKTASHAYPLDGNFTIRLQVRDTEGLVGESSHRATVDSTPPSTTAAVEGTLGSAGWFVSPVFVTLTAMDDRSGVDDIRYRIDAGPWRSYVGRLAIDMQGLHTLDYYSRDLAGNDESPQGLSVSIDSWPPATSLLVNGAPPEPGTLYPAGSIVEFQSTDGGSGVAATFYRIDGGKWQVWSGGFSLTEAHVVDYYSTDLAGNAEETHQFLLQIGASAPPTTQVTLSGTLGNNEWFTSPVQVVLGGSGTVATIRYRLDGGAWTAYSGPFVVPDGEHLIEVQGIDSQGTQEHLHVMTVRADSEVPELSALSLPGRSVDSSVLVGWSGSDATSGLMRYDIQVDGAPWQSLGLSTNATLTLSDGDHLVRVRALDWAGNVKEASSRIRVDTNAFSFEGPLNGAPTIAIFVAVGAIATLLGVSLRSRVRRPPKMPGSPPSSNP